MTERHASLRCATDVSVGKLSAVLRPQVMREIMVHELRPIRVEAIETQSLSIGIVDSGVERAGCDQSTKPGNGIGKPQPLGYLGGSLEIARSQLEVDVDRV